ncbi:TerB family tellurite resistance protein [Ekhidna sp. To15]|uniref:TerB family tellurite resistance protein n=1 Tax=Ekhidna sp. To15 TaxID=3395267 RepID=UPI003F527776
MENNIKNHLKALIQLSIIDRDFGQPEKSYVYTIGKANRVPEKEIDELVEEVLNSKENADVNFEGLLSEERFDYLYDVIQLMKIDGEVFLTEIKYCEDVAQRLGYDKKVVKKMSSRIYGDPSITGNREAIMKEANKYLNK